MKVAGGGANCWAVGDGWRRLKSSTDGVMGEIRDATGGCCLLAEIPRCRDGSQGGRPAVKNGRFGTWELIDLEKRGTQDSADARKEGGDSQLSNINPKFQTLTLIFNFSNKN